MIHERFLHIDGNRRRRPLGVDLLLSTRPKQWIKNGFVFAALVFASKLTHPLLVARSVAAFVLFSMISAAVYLINDVADRDADRRHRLERQARVWRLTARRGLLAKRDSPAPVGTVEGEDGADVGARGTQEAEPILLWPAHRVLVRQDGARLPRLQTYSPQYRPPAVAAPGVLELLLVGVA